MTDDGTYLYTYDPFNRLIAVKKKSTNLLVSQHLYDSSSERASTIAYDASGTATSFTQYLREGAQVVYEKTWTLPGWTVQGEKWYLYGQGKPAVTKETGNGQTTLCYYATDHLGTVRAVVGVDASGMEKSRSLHDYEPYGLEIVPMQVSSHTHRYTGHERDVLDALSNTTLDYMHFRSYASATARFLKPDNVWGNVINPQSWNLYAYCANNPVGRNDPTGHQYSTGAKTRFSFTWDVGPGEDIGSSKLYFRTTADLVSTIAPRTGWSVWLSYMKDTIVSSLLDIIAGNSQRVSSKVAGGLGGALLSLLDGAELGSNARVASLAEKMMQACDLLASMDESDFSASDQTMLSRGADAWSDG